MDREYLPRLKGQVQGCIMNFIRPKLDMDDDACVGFGYVMVYKDGVPTIEHISGQNEFMVRDVEAIATKDPACDWRIVYSQPLSDATYQRQDDGWYLIEIGEGFA